MATAARQRRALLLDDAPEAYATWQATVRRGDPESLIDTIERAGLKGRGGAGFPVGRKLRLTRARQATVRHIVVNGAEDEPGSAKDQFLLRELPDLVIEGALLAAFAAGADHIVFYLSELHPDSASALRQGLGRAAQLGIRLIEPDEQTEPTCGAPTVSVVLSPPTYVAGEDTAALELIEGREPLPREKPPYPVTAGRNGLPTVISNVETLAALARVAWQGADWYRTMGTPDSPGTMLFTLGDEMASPGVYELEIGTPLRELLEQHGGGLRGGEPVRFVLPGGPSSGFLARDSLDAPLSYEALRAAGSALGCGVVRVYGENRCVVEVLHGILEFFARECCGQCPPCRMETGLLLRLTGQVRAGAATTELLGKLPEVLDFAAQQGGLCSFIGMPSLPVRSALRLFPGDFDHHIQTGACPPGLT